MRIDAFRAGIAIFALAAGFAGPTLSDEGPNAPELVFEGNWSVTWEGHPRLSVGRVWLSKGLWHDFDCPATDAGHFCRDPDGPWLSRRVGGAPGGVLSDADIHVLAADGGVIEVSHELGTVSRLRPGEGGDVLIGEWRRGEESGREVWRRLPPPEIERVTCRLGAGVDGEVRQTREVCTFTITEYPGRDAMRGNLPGFSLDVYGRGLWGAGPLPIRLSAEGLEVEAYCYIYPNVPGPDGTPGCHSWGMPATEWGEVIGLRLHLNLFHGATSGARRLSLDGVEVPFVMDLPGHPASEAEPDAEEFVDVET